MAIVGNTTAVGALSIVSILLLLLTLPQHIRVKNVGTIIMIVWTLIGTLAQCITAFLMRDTLRQLNKSILIWLDINSAIQYVYPFGFSIGTLLLMRKLEAIASTRQVSSPVKSRVYLETGCGIICPLLLVPARFVVQGHRNNVIIGYDSSAPLFVSVASLFLAQLPQFILSTVNVVYAGLVLRWFIIRRRQFAAILHSSASNIDKRRYVRLMLLCCFELFLAWPLSLLVNIYNIAVVGFQPYHSWAYVHDGFEKVWVFEYDQLDTVVKAALLLPKYMTIQIAFAFFAFFGLSSETYGDIARFIDRLTGQRKKHTPVNTKSVHTSLSQPTLNSLPDLEDSKDDDELKGSWIPMQTSNILVTSERVVSS